MRCLDTMIITEILRLKEDGATIILSTHNMESVEELCENIALINHGRLVVTGGTDEVRRQHGEDNVEIEYTDDTLARKTLVVARPQVNATLHELLDKDFTINSFKEVIPRMNDIFIKLVKGESPSPEGRGFGRG